MGREKLWGLGGLADRRNRTCGDTEGGENLMVPQWLCCKTQHKGLGRRRLEWAQPGGPRVPHYVFVLCPKGSGEKRTQSTSVTCGSLWSGSRDLHPWTPPCTALPSCPASYSQPSWPAPFPPSHRSLCTSPFFAGSTLALFSLLECKFHEGSSFCFVHGDRAWHIANICWMMKEWMNAIPFEISRWL